ncbi:regulator of protease activity HflC (stomatin/prohibitin superfamily) [Duganella sp. 1411]|jgi:regulator of protease activity HflC (stomatin/prohibitin superfamily)|uniref:SPFH domain-containing protein n=1 Tax=Duganella sp. 1411 TaxID=2806572 RepID=UPI001AE82B22|nr:SPFH domain-containing protein [Duganella sp. 1411]MBP1204478.1 regulator of protease activity HflC (stomatin/prohibitin superfamily) [Duganella sp. 1411]
MNAAHTRREMAFSSTNGYLGAVAGLVLLLGAAYVVKMGLDDGGALSRLVFGLVLGLVGMLCLMGLYMLQPNESAILTLFGRYIGTDRSEGLRWALPFYVKRRLSLRARNFNAPTLKVNDKRGNPVEISAAVVWRVRDTAQAVFEVDDFERYVSIQAEAALRHLASQYAYDEGEDLPEGETTLRGGMDVVADALKCELQARFEAAGVEAVDAKLTHLAYASEIAQVMLRRQQAEAIISARAKIVHGAVSMVESALKGLSERGIVELDDERKAAMVSNLLVVLCSDKETQPIVNTGTLYN